MGLLDIGQIAAAVDNIKRRAKLGLLDPALAFMRAQEDAAAHNKAQDESIAGLRSALPETRKRAIDARSAEAVDMASNFMGGGLLGAIKPVYHGSPHRFDRFDMSKIGTGEGAQAYGHGLYFAENPEVARAYQNTLSKYGQINFRDGTSVSVPDLPYGSAEQVAGQIWLNHPKIDKAKAALSALDPKYLGAPKDAVERALQDISNRGGKLTGEMYTAELEWPAAQLAAGKKPLSPDDLLDWDAPLSKQNDRVRSFFEPLVAPIRKTEGAASGAEWGDLAAPRGYDPTGQELARLLAKRLDTMSAQTVLSGGLGPEVSAALNRAGIPGLRYLDGGSRGAGQGTRNYVIFDDALARILGRE